QEAVTEQTGAPAGEATEGTGEGTARRRRGRRGGRRRRRGGGEAGSNEENGPDTSLLDDDGDGESEGGNTPVATRSQPEFDFDDQSTPEAPSAPEAEEKPAKPPRQPRKRAAAKPQAAETQDATTAAQ